MASVLGSVHDALQNAKELPAILEGYKKELEVCAIIVNNVQGEPALQNSNMELAIINLGACVGALEKQLQSMDKGRKGARAIAYQLVHGSRDKDAIGNLMSRLGRAKDSLTALISVGDAGKLRNLGVQLEQASLASPNATTAGAASSRVIRDNETSDSAFMLNAPVIRNGANVDLWRDIAHVEVMRNTASGSSHMINYANSIENIEYLSNLFLEEERKRVELIEASKKSKDSD